MLSLGSGFGGLVAASVLTIGLAGAAPATTVTWNTPSGPAADAPAVVAPEQDADDTVGLLAFPKTSGPDYADISISAIPVPAAGLLLLTAVGGIAALRRRKSA